MRGRIRFGQIDFRLRFSEIIREILFRESRRLVVHRFNSVTSRGLKPDMAAIGTLHVPTRLGDYVVGHLVFGTAIRTAQTHRVGSIPCSGHTISNSV
jgi:NADPH-dependent 2,4-dienoyl-CoA reductase/sulfur reductase-like enzyme